MEVCSELHAPTALSPDSRDSGTHWMGGRMATEPVQAFWRRKKSRTPANQITIPRSSNTPSFRTSTEIFFFLILTFFYLLIVGILGYFGSWLLSMTHTYTHTHTLGSTPLEEGSARRRDLYLTTCDIHKKQTAMRPAGLELAIPTSEQPQTHVLDGAVRTGGKSHPHRDSIPNRPARSQSLYQLSYPAHKR
jgi:nitrate reductase NapE component